MRRNVALFLCLIGAVSCGEDDAAEEAAPTSGEIGTSGGKFGAETEGGACVPLTESLETDYAVAADDDYPGCISDDGKYVPFNASISASARSKVFDEISALLFSPDAAPSPDAFIEARMLYEEDEGIGSRVVRRYDPHFEAPEGTSCTKEADVKENPEYCVGPAKLLPIVLDAFDKGAKGEEPLVSAGRIEGALLSFFAISTYKESFSCTETLADCDSSYGYYDGAGMGIGLGGRIKAVDAEAYEAAQLGALAVRCWRDVDAAVPAENAELREQARAQFDRAVTRGAISVLLDRIAAAQASTGDARAFHGAFVSTFLYAIAPQTWRDPSAAKVLSDAMEAKDVSAIEFEKLADALESMARCGD